MPRHICLITPGHISSNPRLIKEGKALSDNGYEVSIIAGQNIIKLREFDKKIVDENPNWHFIPIDHTNTSFLKKLKRAKISLRHRIGKFLWFKLKKKPVAALARIMPEQLRVAKRVNADLYIAHNLAALPVAALASKHNHKAYAFDAEDYHRGESEDPKHQQLVKCIEDHFLPSTSYCTSASPLIAYAYQKHYPDKEFICVNNVFPLKYLQPFKQLPKSPLRLFWFSQTVGLNRGIQDVLQALNYLKDIPIELTLVGSASVSVKKVFKEMIIGRLHKLNFLEQVTEDELFELASQHHIGLALERMTPLNRQICLTNKIFSYILAGNVVIASDTPAQATFFKVYPGIGRLYKIGDYKKIAAIIRNWYNNFDKLIQARSRAHELAGSQINWEQEQAIFLSCVEATL